ncbi:restriction endonuclease [uncultured Polaribacter sp.]|uniref:McrC family protein n=1 Tax=uncultured Polaribacter sp. TaxID=174711 RepID=UPI00261056C6|nr:restriction endonuclease [uncultured Polaribacter sp.]
MSNIQVFEHEFLPIEGKFTKNHFIALSKLNELHNDKYFKLRHNGIKFKEYVGVIQVDGLTIEILPKIDSDSNSKVVWQNALIEMLRVTKKLKVQKVGEANVQKQQIHLLDIYFEWFLTEVNLLMHQGLIKQYYKETKNVKALKGKLEFAGHISKNTIHKERFYTTHQVYDKDHLIHQILQQALDIVSHLSKGNYLYHQCKKTLLHFPDVKKIKANENTFSKIPKSRKTAPYKTALAIARLIILNYAPNISKGSEKMLALLFNMNSLWEEYILVKLKEKETENLKIFGQNDKYFWNGITIRPDIIIEKNEGQKKETFVIDTKWKKIDNAKPSTNDLRQMYVYNEYWNAEKAILLYPSTKTDFGEFISFDEIESKEKHHQCKLSKTTIFNQKNELDDLIGERILDDLNLLKQT